MRFTEPDVYFHFFHCQHGVDTINELCWCVLEECTKYACTCKKSVVICMEKRMVLVPGFYGSLSSRTDELLVSSVDVDE
jgi:hypothetical protein